LGEKKTYFLAMIAKFAYKQQGNLLLWDKPLWLPIRAKQKHIVALLLFFSNFGDWKPKKSIHIHIIVFLFYFS
jgi:hypothetical protein